MNKTKAKLLLNVTTTLFLIGIVFLFYNKEKIGSDSDLGTFISEKSFNFSVNDKNYDFNVKLYSKNNINTHYLIKNNLSKIKRVELPGFEDEINLCRKPTLKIDGKDVICLVGDVGVHSQSIVFIDKDISLINIYDASGSAYNVTSDAPNYNVLDYNNDGADDLIIDNRDYDKDPLVDTIRDYYLGSNNGFVFDKEESIAVK